jgi:hypothetical protein
MSMSRKRSSKRFTCLVFVLVLALTVAVLPGTASAASVNIINAIQWATTSGTAIQAHGGGMIKVGSNYYWFGENRDDTGHFLGVSCYRSSDLKSWTYVRDVLTKTSAAELNYCWIERPKVMYNASTNTYVMWMHWENGTDYGDAKAAVAYCSTVDGSYTYQGSFRPYENQGITDHGKDGYMSRDCNVFVDTDGTGYFISSSNENMDLHLYKLTSNYRNIDTLVTKLFVGSQREAPCLFKRGSYYFLLTSGCTGWTPNQAKYSCSSSLASGWSSLTNIGDSNTFYSQPAFVIPVQGSSTTTYLYTGDRWGGAWSGKVNESMYVWAPLSFPTATSMSMSWCNNLTIDTATGTVTGSVNNWQFKNQNSGKVLNVTGSSTSDGAAVEQRTASTGNSMKWQLAYDGAGYFEFKNINSGKNMDVTSGSTADNASIIQWTDNNGANQKWRIIDKGNGYFKLQNKNSGKVIDVASASTADGAKIIQYTDNGGTNQAWQLVAQ